jgi:hypothetical protein
MDILMLIDRLDDVVHNAKIVPLTGQVRLDKDDLYDALDQMRACIPEEIKQARAVLRQAAPGDPRATVVDHVLLSLAADPDGRAALTAAIERATAALDDPAAVRAAGAWRSEIERM